MQSFTKNEIAWMIDVLEVKAHQLTIMSQMASANDLERSLYNLRAEQMTVITDKLRRAIETGSKRIEIKL